MAEEVKIVVKEERQGTALRDAQKDVSALQQPKEHWQRLDAEARVTRELREQNAILQNRQRSAGGGGGGHGGHGGMGNARMIGDLLDMATGQMGWVYRMQQVQNLPHLLKGMMGSPIAGPAALAALAAGGGLAHMAAEYENRQDKESLANRVFAMHGVFNRQTARGTMFGAGSESLMGEEVAHRERADALRDERQELERKRDSAAFGLKKLFGFEKKTLFGRVQPEQLAIEENEKTESTERRFAERKAEERKKAFERDGGLDLRIAEARAGRDMRTMRALEHEKTWWGEYFKVKKQLGDAGEGQAQEAANLAVWEVQRQQGIAIGRHAAGGGNAAIARLASIASNPNPPVVEAISKLTRFVEMQHNEASQRAWRQQFERKWGRHG